MTPSLDEDFWEDLLTLIEEGKVIPVIGAGVVTRADDDGLFYPWLARRLAERLGISLDTRSAAVDLNDVATAHLLKGGDNNVLYTRLARILRDECPAPGQSLLDLASISAFNLYLTTTFDQLLQKALDSVRKGGTSATSVYAFSPGAKTKDLPARRRDLPGTTVFHLLGRVSSMPEYVVWEEDMLEFIFALNKHMPVMERLGRDLKEHGLLFLGLHFSDWLVRFFLRVSKQEPLSTPRVHRAYLADGPEDFSPQSLVLFFGAVSRDIHVMRQDPVLFCSELARRWKARHPDREDGTKLSLPATSPEMPRGAIFISYAREDETAAAAIVRDLQNAGCTVWYDRDRLQAGQDWHNSLEDEVKRRCGLFLSVISRTTEATRESYYHLERNWAASRAERIAHDEEFYIPVVIDDSPLAASREPRHFQHIQATRLTGGAVTPDFAEWVLGLQAESDECTPMIVAPTISGSSVTPESPWLGLRSFTEEAQSFFFGRSDELDDLYERILDKPLAVLFGQSGLGKSSLLQAALVPRLRTTGFLPVFIRFDHDTNAPALESQLLDSLRTALESSGYTQQAAAIDAALTNEKASLDYAAFLWLLFHDPEYGFIPRRGTPSDDFPRTVFLIDQFEEIFTLGQRPARRSTSAAFRETLAALVENRPPSSLREMLEEDDDLAERLDYKARHSRVLLSLREDFLHLLERWRRSMPSLMENRLELRMLSGPQAFLAVVRPGQLRQELPAIIPDQVGQAIVRFVAGADDDVPLEQIDAVPPLLSLVCAELNAQRLDSGEPQITQAQFEGHGTDILSSFYLRSFDLATYGAALDGVPDAGSALKNLRALIEDRLLSPDGFRESIAFDTIARDLSHAAQPDASRAVLDRLVERRLLTVEERGGVRRIELAHDVLTRIVKTSRDERHEVEAVSQSQVRTGASRGRDRPDSQGAQPAAAPGDSCDLPGSDRRRRRNCGMGRSQTISGRDRSSVASQKSGCGGQEPGH